MLKFPFFDFLPFPLPIKDQRWSDSTVPLVSVCCITYNHDKFIRKCIEGFLNQKTTFPVEILIHDDASLDCTASIIREYQIKYQTLIKPIYQIHNQYSKGFRPLTQIIFPRARGEYIALCEGDDYWTDMDKIQYQFNLMEGERECSFCFHNVLLKYEDNSSHDHLFFSNKKQERYTLADLLDRNFIPTPSVFFRNSKMLNFPSWFYEMPFGDWPLHVINAKNGYIRYIDKNMAVYRKHTGGLWTSLSPIKGYRSNIKFYKIIKDKSNIGFDNLIDIKISQNYRMIADVYDVKSLNYFVIKSLFLSFIYNKSFVNTSRKKFVILFFKNLIKLMVN